MAAIPLGCGISAMMTGDVAALNHRIDEPKLFMASGRAAHLARAQLAVNNFAARVKFERLPHEFNHHSHEEC
jgi:hypothetical protein